MSRVGTRAPRWGSAAGFVLALFILTFLTAPSAHAQTADGNPRWCTVAGAPGLTCTPDALSSCKAQFDHYKAKTSVFTGYEYYSKWSRLCDWTNPLVLPTLTGFTCDNGFYRSPTADRCIKDETKQLALCDSNDANVGNPILLATGSKTLAAKDFSSSDARFSVDRAYRSLRSSGVRVNHGPVRGLGVGWQFNFAMELHITGSSFSSTPEVSLYISDGSQFDLIRNASGVMVPYTKSGVAGHYATYKIARNDYKLELVGSWPANLNDVPVTATQWKVTDPEDRVWLLQAFAHPFQKGTRYIVARPTSVEWRDGYKWTYTYGANDRLTKIEDTFGRAFSFTWIDTITTYAGTIPSAISEVALPDGNKVVYSYDPIVSGLTTNPQPDRLVKVEQVDSKSAVTESTTYHFEDVRHPVHVTGITDGRGVRVTNYAYDGLGRATMSETVGAVDKITVAYADTPPNITRTVTNALGKQSTYKFTRVSIGTSGTNTSEMKFVGVDGIASTNCPSSATAVTHDANYYPATETDEEGRVTAYVRDALGRPTSITRGSGKAEAVTTTVTYHGTLNVPTQIVEPGRTADYTWTSGRLTSMTQTDTTSHSVPYATNGQTRTWGYTYGTGGNLLTVDGPLSGAGDTVTYTYDADGYLASVKNELSQVTTINTVNQRGQPTKVTDANSIATEMTYDSQGRLKTVTVDPGGNQAVTSMDYDEIGQLTKITRPDGSHLTYVYNTAKQLTEVVQDDGQKIEYGRDALGGITSRTIKTAGGSIVFNQTQTFDELGRLLKHIGANTQTTTHAYEKNNNLKSVTDPRSGLYSYAYDAVNRLIRETDQESMQVNYTLDGQGQVINYIDPRTLQTDYVRNGFGDVIRRTSPDSGITDYVLDARGLVTQITDARSVVTDLTYDDAGRMLTKTFPGASAENITYSYDATAGGNKGIGRLTQLQSQNVTIAFTYDARGNVTQEVRTIGGQAHTVSYTYDLADRITQITYPSGRIVDYARDSTGRITDVTTKASALASPVTVASSIDYMPLSALVKGLSYGNGLTETNTWTQDYEQGRCEVKDGSTALIDDTFGRSDLLNLTGITDGVVSGNTQSFAYSAANRLKDASGAYGSLNWTYDGVGNRTQEIATPIGGPTTTRTLSYPGGSNRLSGVTIGGTPERAFTYDGAGNIASDTRSGVKYDYAYNARNRLETVTVASSLRGTYTYNGLEQLSIRVLTNMTPSGTSHLVHDRRGNVIAETDGSGSSGTQREYIWLPEAEIAPAFGSRAQIDRPLAVVDQVATAPVMYWVHVDQLSRPIRMTDGSKASVWDAVWAPWGAPHLITGAAALDARFPGQWFQLESGLHYNWHRHYDPSLGRYTQPDPLGFVDGPSVYAYAKGNPLATTDITGLASLLPSLPPGGSSPVQRCNFSTLTCQAAFNRCNRNIRLSARCWDALKTCTNYPNLPVIFPGGTWVPGGR